MYFLKKENFYYNSSRVIMVCNLFYILTLYFFPKNISFSAQQKSFFLLLLISLLGEVTHISKCLKYFCSFSFFLLLLKAIYMNLFTLLLDPARKYLSKEKKNHRKRERDSWKWKECACKKIKKFSYQLGNIFQANKILCNL